MIRLAALGICAFASAALAGTPIAAMRACAETPQGLVAVCDRPLPTEPLQTFIAPSVPVDSEIVRFQFAVPAVKAAPSLRLVPLSALVRSNQ